MIDPMKILNVHNLRPGKMADILQFCDDRIRKGHGAFLVPMNPIKVIKASRRPEFQGIIDGADWVFPDSWGIAWAAGLLHRERIPLTPGYRVMFSLLAQAEARDRGVYILGTTDGALESGIDRLRRDYPKLRVLGRHHGFFKPPEAERIFKNIADLEPQYVFVAMGEYKQELIIQRLRAFHPKAIYLGVGGSIDLLSGKQPTPPAWIRRNHLEWLFRLIRQPFRAPRFQALPIFVAMVLREKLRAFNGGKR